MQSPGLDILAPPPPGEMGLLVWESSFQILGSCYPPDLVRKGLSAFSRPPQMPGDGMNHFGILLGEQLPPLIPGRTCVNDTSAPPLQRLVAYLDHGHSRDSGGVPGQHGAVADDPEAPWPQSKAAAERGAGASAADLAAVKAPGATPGGSEEDSLLASDGSSARTMASRVGPKGIAEIGASDIADAADDTAASGDGRASGARTDESSASSQAGEAAGPAPGVNVLTLLPTLLGRGGFGQLVEGRYQSQPVAVKLLRWGVLETCSANEPLPPGLLHAFQSEVEVLACCQHPNVVSLLAVCVQPPRLCLVMERMDCSLEALIYGAGGGMGPQSLLPLPKVLHIAHQVCCGLEYLHPHVVHRDLKPANVLLNHPASPRPCVKLVDFGLARTQLSTRATEHPEAGTIGYIAPEAYDVENFVVRHHADIYSMGVLIWAMLTGRVPWEGCAAVEVAIQLAINRQQLPFHQLGPDRCPRKLQRLLLQCWDFDPERRPAAAELAKELLVLQELVEHGRL
ncbi:hypothetical protein HYH03_014540 [Edaphochlamys debaryana]|uniref:Protein kinase domain-containing protein n=1 Tax=Edaphochlamys debaryana TaxID=47281 RepID=A0A835XL73_9CHLO|nr:hypothetical protein HYH03_014540 [Edaphochlamys debaryana]|eukprot:KAG2486857.1 hypothetical protein HYH03_014540 [Edaphochlamys debaryana]